MKKLIANMCLCFLCAFCIKAHKLYAQTSFPIINKDILFQNIKDDHSGAKFFMVGIFSNYCHGRNYIPPYIKMIDSITNHQTRYFICQSSHDESDRGKELTDVINAAGINGKYIYLIDGSKYKTKKKDERKQGQEFRDDICPACQFSIISGTYYIVFNKQGIIMYSGYTLKPAQMAAILTCNK